MPFSFAFPLVSAVLATLLATAAPASATDSTQVELLGIFASSDAARSTALVSIQGQESLIVRVGQPLPGGFRLQAIAHDRVQLAHDGRTFQLMLQGRKRGTADPPSLPSQASSSMAPVETVPAAYADACNALAGFDQAQREELQSLGVCSR